MSNEWTGICAAIQWLKNRGFYFEESTFSVILSDSCEHSCTGFECSSYFRIHDQVNVSHTITLFLISKAMPLIREWAQSLGKNSVAFYANGDFAGVGAEYNAVNTNDIASVQKVEQLPFSVCQGILTEVELNVASCVTKSCHDHG